ncbi:hypothetical protein NAP1_05950 [Erythrobacter sp. NAP1]|uniref:SH3 domain-containing protein n=1 Tax=Erythrobacter sp. NAP1 TaxID=237727 RepID=UPI0000686C5E|nr:SH3 domain-containing protein [Erythrobacter sp. NAP1]EAQ30296.1 hypothetical protein NAP1_05950 [Erythrobacter sp. NAP1]
MTALRFFAVLGLCLVLASAIFTDALRAQNREVPYWATLRFDEVNMRVGPSQEYKIDWVYKRKGLPVKVVRVRESWRLVQDHEGTQGWVAASQLNPKLGVLIIGEGLTELREEPAANSVMRWLAEPGVVGELIECRDNFCEIDVDGRVGWVAMDRLWGVGSMEPDAP